MHYTKPQISGTSHVKYWAVLAKRSWEKAVVAADMDRFIHTDNKPSRRKKSVFRIRIFSKVRFRPWHECIAVRQLAEHLVVLARHLISVKVCFQKILREISEWGRAQGLKRHHNILFHRLSSNDACEVGEREPIWWGLSSVHGFQNRQAAGGHPKNSSQRIEPKCPSTSINLVHEDATSAIAAHCSLHAMQTSVSTKPNPR